jgi:hypothetical protein
MAVARPTFPGAPVRDTLIREFEQGLLDQGVPAGVGRAKTWTSFCGAVMAITCGFGEDRDGWKSAHRSNERPGRRRPTRKRERWSLKLLKDLSRVAHLDDFTRMRFRMALRRFFDGGSPPPPLLPA